MNHVWTSILNKEAYLVDTINSKTKNQNKLLRLGVKSNVQTSDSSQSDESSLKVEAY